MPSDYRLSVRNDQAILFRLAYKTAGGKPLSLDNRAAFFYYSDSAKPSTGKVDGNVIEFNIPTGKTRGPLASKYRVELKDLDSEASEVILSGPLTVANDDK